MGDEREEIARLSRLRDELYDSVFVMDAVCAAYPNWEPMGVKLREDLDAILARQGPGPGEAVAWRPMTPDLDHVGPALCAVRVYTCGKFQGWDIHYVVIDDETREIAPDFEQGWAISDYEFWMPIAPPSMIAATPTREA